MDNKLLQTNFLKVLKENKELRKKVEMLEKEARHLKRYLQDDMDDKLPELKDKI
ncbi:MAG: hypothetical protein O3A39_06830 [Proteobacteria bacterium]|nr:hypothetical protein [Pseudomonadota bacterium]